ncbi:MAG TPA: DUF4032 domain-containing protein [Trebonia sp.]
MRFVFTPPADEAAGLLSLPWAEPLEDWTDERLVEIRQRGISRHVVRFVSDDGVLYALKSISERLARREFRLLRFLADLGIPAVSVVGVAVDLGKDADAILVTKFLPFATTYRAVFSSPRGLGPPTDKLLDALVELLVRLHLSGFFWGDCSLSNALFRYDAGRLEAYLVDSETSEQHPELSAGQRHYDVELAVERVFGELLDLQAGDLLPADIDPLEVAAELQSRYERLWDELTREEIIPPDEQRFRIAERLRRLNELGFDADEVELIKVPEGNRLRVRTRVAESAQHSRELFLGTGLNVRENQARRLLNDIAAFRAYLEQKEGRPVSQVVAASRWLTEVYDPVVAAIPEDLRGRLAPAEVFHEVLEHRWYVSEQAGRDVGTTAAARSYFKRVLPQAPEPLEAGGSELASLRGRFPDFETALSQRLLYPVDLRERRPAGRRRSDVQPPAGRRQRVEVSAAHRLHPVVLGVQVGPRLGVFELGAQPAQIRRQTVGRYRRRGLGLTALLGDPARSPPSADGGIPAGRQQRHGEDQLDDRAHPSSVSGPPGESNSRAGVCLHDHESVVIICRAEVVTWPTIATRAPHTTASSHGA